MPNDDYDFIDLLNDNAVPGTITAGKKHFNIDDPAYAGKWHEGDLKLELPGIEPEGPPSCEQECREKQKERSKNCALMRKRAALALKQVGCPSRVTAIPKKKSKCAAKKSRKKKTTKKSRGCGC